MRFATLVLVLALVLPAVPPAAAQTQHAPDHLALGDSALRAFKSEEALGHYQAILAQDSLRYGANIGAALAAIDFARQRGDLADYMGRDSIYRLANDYARRAVRADSTKGDGHLLIALSLARLSEDKGPLYRLKLAGEIFQEATKATQLDPKSHGAYHVLGRWHREVYNGRQMAPGLVDEALGELGAKASLEASVECLEKAVQFAPNMIYHRLDLAQSYMAVHRVADARVQLLKIDSLPATDPVDPIYKDEAQAMLVVVQLDDNSSKPAPPKSN